MQHKAFIARNSFDTENDPQYLVPEDMTFQSSEIEMQEFLYGLVRYLKPRLVFESGCNRGYSTMAMGSAVEGSNQYNAPVCHGRVVSCDVDPEMVEFAKRVCKDNPSVTIKECAALDCPELAEADLIFSDSSYESRRKEYEIAKSGAVIVVHDTRIDGPTREFVKSKGGQLFDRGRGFGIIVKP